MGLLRRIYRKFSPASASRIFKSSTAARPAARVERIVPDPDRNGLRLDELELLASRIPSMGGTEIGAQLRRAARLAPANTAIVEVGSWLGAGTAQLALGLRDRPSADSVAIHCYDRWEANEPEVAKAVRLKNVKFEIGDDTLPWVMNTLRPFAVPISFMKADLRDATWGGGPISVYVDDAAKTPTKFLHVLRTFGPQWIPGVTIVVLMDFHYWEKSGSEKHRVQQRFVGRHPHHFEQIAGFRTGSCDAFLYCKRLEFDELRRLF